MLTPEEQEEEESKAIYDALAVVCSGKRSIVIISALTNLLANVVTETALTSQGVDSFEILFKDELRRRWVARLALEPGEALAAPVDG